MCLSSSCELEGDDPRPLGIAGDCAVTVKGPEEVWAYCGGSPGPSQCQLFQLGMHSLLVEGGIYIILLS